jgi:hypothetical protein
MCVTITFREASVPARFCNRYVSSASGDLESGGDVNAVAMSATLDVLDALGLVDAYEGRPPHVQLVDASLHIARGERVAELRRVRAPRVVHRGRRIRLRLTLQRMRAGKLTRTVSVRVGRHARLGHRTLVLRGGGDSGDSGSPSALLDLVLGGGSPPKGPATLRELIGAIDAIGRRDGVVARLGREHLATFRDSKLLITGRARTKVVVRRR